MWCLFPTGKQNELTNIFFICQSMYREMQSWVIICLHISSSWLNCHNNLKSIISSFMKGNKIHQITHLYIACEKIWAVLLTSYFVLYDGVIFHILKLLLCNVLSNWFCNTTFDRYYRCFNHSSNLIHILLQSFKVDIDYLRSKIWKCLCTINSDFL